MTNFRRGRRIRGWPWYEEGMNEPRVLVCDDDDDIRRLVCTLLERTGATVHQAADGREALREFHAWRPELVILDVSMPELDGWAVLERIRDLSDVPVLMLTARGEELERVRGLQGGADDYVVKPFGKQELVARVQALLRRAAKAPHEEEPESYGDGYLTIDYAQRQVTVGERQVQLTPLEFRLLSTLRPQPAAGAEPRPAARARLGRHLRRRRRPGEALRRLSPPQARRRTRRRRCRSRRCAASATATCRASWRNASHA